LSFCGAKTHESPQPASLPARLKKRKKAPGILSALKMWIISKKHVPNTEPRKG
jgi:hypothetical protein